MADIEKPDTVNEVLTPALLIDIDRAKKNAQKMINICEKFGVQLRPHMKTHKTVQLGELMTNGTKRRIEVSTIEEAEFFARNGFDDILYAYPLIKPNIKRCKKLAESIESFHVMIESDHGLEALLECPLDKGRKWSVYLEVDDGCGRTGVPWESNDVLRLASAISDSPNLILYGIYLYNGRSYQCSSKDELQKCGKDAAEKFSALCKRFSENNINCGVLSIGNTPSCSHPHSSMNVVTEFHPGNYILYDVMQSRIGSCSLDEIACRLATRVIGHKPANNILLIDCGFLALSIDGKATNPDDFATFKGNPDLNHAQQHVYIQSSTSIPVTRSPIYGDLPRDGRQYSRGVGHLCHNLFFIRKYKF